MEKWRFQFDINKFLFATLGLIVVLTGIYVHSMLMVIAGYIIGQIEVK